ncbi:hypothetical protein [Staphylococcus borealis]|uniref:hypothetical protein n=1 Tax=Staphylococcus borealis TaxID=2742203 RepID=UPI0039E887C2
MTNDIPEIVKITSTDIAKWADQIDARKLLPVLLRKLINSTLKDIKFIDFPGYDNSQRQGSDGIVDTNSFNAFVPNGKSHWEFGTTQIPKSKADSDYTSKTRQEESEYKKEHTFIFVTPRKWSNKNTWVEEKKKKINGKT